MKVVADILGWVSIFTGLEAWALHALVGAQPVVGYAVLTCVGSLALSLWMECKANQKKKRKR